MARSAKPTSETTALVGTDPTAAAATSARKGRTTTTTTTTTAASQGQRRNKSMSAPPSTASWTIVHTLLAAIALGMVVCAMTSFYMLHASTVASLVAQPVPLQDFVRLAAVPHVNDTITAKNSDRTKTLTVSQLAGLDCSRYGGPDDPSEMVYWRDIPQDQTFQSPFRRDAQQQTQYMTFEPDGGGWNNIRMAMETVLGLAIATGRTLVLPPAQRMYLLGKDRDKHKTQFTFADFFPMHQMSREHAGLDIITMKEFLEETAMKGQLRNKFTGQVEFPPDNNRTDWDGQDFTVLKEWLRNVTVTPTWSPGRCLAAFPARGGTADVQELVAMQKKIETEGRPMTEFVDEPVPVDASPMERLRENMSGRRQLCVYDEAMQQAPVVHFLCSHKLKVRMLVHFYAFLFFEDWREDLWMKRFMRDHVRYLDEIQCAAARVVHAMRQYARTKPGNHNGDFDTFHIRRGDFQFKRTRIDAKEIYENVKDILPDGAIVYVATDERDKKFFDPLKQHYDIKFMDDFKDVLEGVNTNYFGMIDQLVASRGVKFFGCWHSTFTGFINRMRAYHASKDKTVGYEKGVLPNSFYYVPMEARDAMHRYAVLHGAFFNREFPVSWKDIDKGVEELAARAKEQ